MKTRTLSWAASLGAAMLMGSVAFAQAPEGGAAAGTSSQPAGTAGHSANAGSTAAKSPSQPGSTRRGRRHPKIYLGHHRGTGAKAKSSTTSTSGGGTQTPPTGSGANTGTTNGTSSTQMGAGRPAGSGTTGAGSQTGSGNASQGNLPNQQGNQTENHQNNSQNNKNTNISTGTILTGLVNVNAQNINVNVYKLIDIHNVLNNSQVEILTQKIQNSPGARANQNVLNNLFRNAKILNGNKVIVGLLSKQHIALTENKSSAAASSSAAK